MGIQFPQEFWKGHIETKTPACRKLTVLWRRQSSLLLLVTCAKQGSKQDVKEAPAALKDMVTDRALRGQVSELGPR